jgi:hypothetical protein
VHPPRIDPPTDVTSTGNTHPVKPLGTLTDKSRFIGINVDPWTNQALRGIFLAFYFVGYVDSEEWELFIIAIGCFCGVLAVGLLRNPIPKIFVDYVSIFVVFQLLCLNI